jgi:WD40 repeat protein
MREAFIIFVLICLASCAATPKIYVKTANMAMEVKSKVPYVEAVDYSSDGKSIISGGVDGTIRLWDLTSAREAMKFEGHTGCITDVSFSPDGRTIASISLDGTIRLWDVAAGRQIQKISGYSWKDRYQRVRYSPDGKYVVGSTVTTVKLHEVQTDRLVKEFSGYFFHEGGKIAPDGKAILMPDKRCTEIVLKDVTTGNEIWRTKIGKSVHGFAFMPNGKQILVVRQQLIPGNRVITNLVLLNASTGNQIKELVGTVIAGYLSHYIEAIALSPDGRFALTGDLGGNYRLWDISSGTMVRQLTIEDESDPTTILNISPAVAFSPDGRTAVVNSRASVRLYDVSTGDEIITMIAFEDGEWLAITSDGYYNSSAKGAQYLSVKFEGKDYTVDQFYDVFYRPDIVAARLSWQDVSGLISITMKDAQKSPPPMVEFTSQTISADQQKTKICYRVKSAGGGIGEVRLFHNGKLIQSDGYYREVAKLSTERTQLALLNSKAIYEDMRSVSIKGKVDSVPLTSKSKGDVFNDCREVEAIPGDNEVSVAAFNGNNTIQGAMKTIHFSSAIKSEAPHLYILAIGIDQHRDNSINLKYAVKDAKDIEEKLKVQAATLYNPRNIHYTMLTDREATKTSIINKIEDLAKTIKPQDSFILFVAGHGLLLQNQYYMLTHDFNGQVSDANMISSNEIVEMSKKIMSLSQLFIFDTCHAGGVDTIVRGLYDARMSVLAKKMGLHIYASANDKQSAMDGYKGNGLFTHTLLDGLNNNREADKYKDGKVSIVGLGEYSKKMTTNLSKEIGHSQTPLIINFGKDNPIYKLP